MDCPKCETRLKIVTFDDGDIAGECPDCGAWWKLQVGSDGLELSRETYSEPLYN